MLKPEHLDGALRQEQMQERADWRAANEPGSASASPWERGRLDALAGKAAPDLVRPDGAWSARLYAAGWDRGAERRKTTNVRANLTKGAADEA